MDDDEFMEDALMDRRANAHEVIYWLPKLVVLATFTGFLALAWYAYQTGTQSLSDEDLVLVEADKTPMKEKPADPGGMKFPNQDKTIFETFASNAGTPPKVEHVMPAPEEPLPRVLDTSETKTWINEKLKKTEDAQSKPVQTAMKDGTSLVKEVPPPVAASTPAPTEKVEKPAVEQPKVSEKAPEKAPEAITSYTAEKQAPKPEKKEAKKEEKPKKRETAKSVGGSGAKVQLGAYRSEEEAEAAFAKMQKKFSELEEMDAIIVKADLGAKGVYYRLRVGGFADAASAKEFCGELSGKGQACILAQ